MVSFASYEGKLIKMMKPYPIYDRYDDNKVIGYTKVGDMAVITYVGGYHDYFEVIIVSGEYTGIDTLALNEKDIQNCVFVFNRIDEFDYVTIKGDKVKHENV